MKVKTDNKVSEIIIDISTDNKDIIDDQMIDKVINIILDNINGELI